MDASRPPSRRIALFALAVALLGGAAVAAAVAPPASGAPLAQAQEVPLEEIGRLLFWDPVMSGAMDVACATCHHPDFAYADGRALALGTGSVGLGPDRRDLSGGVIPVVKRNSPTILNVAYNGIEEGDGDRDGRDGDDDFAPLPATISDQQAARAPMFWDRRIRSLEAQALIPLTVREEMRGDAYEEDVAVDSVMARLNAIPEYVELFEAVTGEDTIEPEHVADAIVAFERMLVTRDSPYDRYLAGDVNALSAQELRGMQAFEDADCTSCHEGPMLSEWDLVTEGVADNPLNADPDIGAGRFRFRTPSLRNVGLTAPYMHSGMIATLPEVLEFYNEGDSRNPLIFDRRRNGDDGDDDDNLLIVEGRTDGQFRGVDDMTDQEMEDIVAFLESMSDTNFDRTIPGRVPSGLNPGGAIGGATAAR
jgi:cytochrome c peroxidase